MMSEKAGGSTRRKGSTRRGGSERTAKKVAGQSQSVSLVAVDPWGSFFEQWGQAAEGGSADQQAGEQKPARGTRKTGTKPGR